jgi:hypothetical protein
VSAVQLKEKITTLFFEKKNRKKESRLSSEKTQKNKGDRQWCLH